MDQGKSHTSGQQWGAAEPEQAKEGRSWDSPAVYGGIEHNAGSSATGATDPQSGPADTKQDNERKDDELLPDSPAVDGDEGWGLSGVLWTMLGIAGLGAAAAAAGGSDSDGDGDKTPDGVYQLTDAGDVFRVPSDARHIPVSLDMQGGDDVAAIVGTIDQAQADDYSSLSNAELYGSNTQLQALAPRSELTALRSSTDLAVSSTLNGGSGDDVLAIFGDVDLSRVSVTGFESVQLHSDLTLLIDQLATIGSLTLVGGSTHSLTLLASLGSPASDDEIRALFAPGGVSVAGEGDVVINGTNYGSAEDLAAWAAVALEAAPDSLSLQEDTAGTTGNVLDNDYSSAGALSPAAITAHSQGENGAVVDNGDGTFTYTPVADFSGQDSFTYTLTQGGEEVVGTVTVVVEDVNDAPVAEDDSYQFADTSSIVTGDVLANDTDDGGLTAGSISGFTQGSHGTVAYNGDGTFTFTPGATFVGEDSFSYTVEDAQGLTHTATVSILAPIGNTDPVAGDDTAAGDEDTVITTENVLANDSDLHDDLDGDSITEFTQGAFGQVVYNGDGTFDYTPGADFHGEDAFLYTVEDSESATSTATVTITVNPVNDAPVTEDDEAGGLHSDIIVVPNVLANDSDPEGYALVGSDVTEFSQGEHGTVTYNGDGTFNYQADANFAGQDTFTYTVTDDGGETATGTVVVLVQGPNFSPRNEVPGEQSLEQNESHHIVGLAVSDQDDGVLTVTLSVSHGTLSVSGGAAISGNNSAELELSGSIATLNATLSTLQYSPAINYGGPDTLVMHTVDGGGGSGIPAEDTDQVALFINESATIGGDYQGVVEDGGDLVATGQLTASDPDGDDNVFIPQSNVGGNYGVLNLSQDGAWEYSLEVGAPAVRQLAQDQVVVDRFDIQSADGTAGVILVNVRGANDAPDAVDDAYFGDEGEGLVTGNVLANDSDIDNVLTAGDLVSFSQASNGQVTYNGDGTFTYQPSGNFSGNDSFTYTLEDAHGARSTATVNLTITDVNDPPVALNDTASGLEDTVITTGNVLANDSDDSGVLTAANIISFSQAGHGTVSHNGDGTFDYTPGADFSGSDSFTYTVADGFGATDSATVYLTVDNVNDAPTAGDDTMVVDENSSVSKNLLANDADPDDTLGGASIDGFTQPAHGTVSHDGGGNFTYTPDADYFGSDSFTYTVVDSGGLTDTATVTVTVNEVNEPPVAGADSASGAEDTVITTGNVLANDADPDDVLSAASISGFSQGNWGTVGYNNDGTFTYTPDLNFEGTDTFTYTLDDGRGGTGQGVVTVTVTPVPDAPIARDDYVRGIVDTVIRTVNVLANDEDPDLADTLVAGSIVSFTDPSQGSLIDNGDGTFDYTPNSGYIGSDSFTYTVTDDSGATDTATVHLEVTPPYEGFYVEGDYISFIEDANVDLREVPNDAVRNITEIDMENYFTNSLTMNEDDFLALLGPSEELYIYGNTGDTLNIEGVFSDFGARLIALDRYFDIYTHDNSDALLFVEENHIAINFY